MSTPTACRRLGRYTLQSLLGRGGMGEVWEAELEGPHGFRKSVAVKVLSQGPNEAAREALLREARLGALLQHPNVVATFELGEADGTWFVAMELVRGASLAELLSTGPLAAGVVLDVGVQVCAGLSHMHGLVSRDLPNGLVHRDIKPANLLLDTTGLVKIVDLGISALAGSVSGRAGTPGYMAPEAWADEGGGDARSDLFALGVTLFAAATGQRPFPTGSAARQPIAEVEKALSAGLLDPVEESVPGLAGVLHTCLRADPRDRCQSAAELGAAIGRLRGRKSGAHLLVGRPTSRPDTPQRAVTTVALAPGNLPRSSDRFVGRSAELSDVVQRAGREGCLLTLTGLGGSGKTRLALEALRELRSQLPGGGWFFDLSAADSELAVCSVVSLGFGVQLVGTDPVGQLGYAIQARGRIAVGLDNLEQLGAIASTVVARWVTLAPDATWVCTSRSALRIRREHRIPLGPLTLEDGLQLFADRAPNAVDLDSIRKLVTALDGHPLSIELAAARTRHLTPADVLARLGDRLRLLAGGERDRPPRHQSLRASLDGSWELLSECHRSALAQLTVFAGGFNPAAVEAILDLSSFPDAGWALDVLGELVDASLVRVQPRTDRFTLQAVVAAYAEQKLTGSARVEAEARHFRYFSQLGAPAALAALDTRGGEVRRRRVSTELDNIEVATLRALVHGDADCAVSAFSAVYTILEQRGPLDRARSLAERVLAMPGLANRARAQVTLSYARLESTRGVKRAWDLLLEALPLAEGDGRLEAPIHSYLGWVSGNLGHLEAAHTHYAAATDLAWAYGDAGLEAKILANVGLTYKSSGDATRALAAYTQALALNREVGNRRGEAINLGNLGVLFLDQGRYDDAEQMFLESVAIHRESTSTRFEAVMLCNLGAVLYERGHIDDAKCHFDAALAGNRAVGDRRTEVVGLINLGGLARHVGSFGEALDQLQAALALARELGDRLLGVVALCSLGRLAASERRREVAGGRLAEALTLAREIGDRMLMGEVLFELASLDLQSGAYDLAQPRVQEAESLLCSMTNPLLQIRFLAVQARLAAETGDLQLAHEKLAEVAALLARLGVGPDSESWSVAQEASAAVERVAVRESGAVAGRSE